MAAEPHSVRDAEPAPSSSIRALRLDPMGVVAPPFCACCAAPAASSRVERRGAGVELIIPYCVRCLRHASAATTRSLAAALGSCLVAFTLALALPLAWPSAGLMVNTCVVLFAACLPLLLRLRRPRVEPGHSSAERAVWWMSDGRLACCHPRFAAVLAEQKDAELEEVPRAEPRFAPWLVVGPVVALIGGPSSWFLHHPVVRVLNLTAGRIEVQVDGRTVVAVEPSSTENPTAGAELRMPSGDHDLAQISRDGAVSKSRVTLESGGMHLFAPGSGEYCFWLEETRYGRDEADESVIVPLTGESRFWVLPRQVDTWFAENPTPAAPDRRSSGGVLVALRQAPCAQAPRAARP